MTLVTSRGILLRSHPYSESSRILRFFTPEHGVVALVARGARKRTAKGASPMETFGEGTLSFAHRPDRDLHTLRDFELPSGGGGSSLSLARDVRRFAGASLVAEFLLAHTLEEGDPDLYEWVSHTFRTLARAPDDEVSGRILAGAWRTLSHLGFPPELDWCVQCGRELNGEGEGEMQRFDIGAGGLRCPACVPESSMPRIGPGARRQLRLLVVGEAPVPLTGARAHLGLLESFALHHLAPRAHFRAFEILRPLLPQGVQKG